MKNQYDNEEKGSYPSLESKTSTSIDDTYLVPVDTVKVYKDKNKNIYSADQEKRNSRDLNNPIYRTIDYADVRAITLSPISRPVHNDTTYTGLTRERFELAVSTNSTLGLINQTRGNYVPLNNTYSGLQPQTQQDNYAPLNDIPNNIYSGLEPQTQDSYAPLNNVPNSTYSGLTAVPNTTYSELNLVQENYASIDTMPDNNPYTGLTRHRNDTILSTTGSTCSLINNAAENYTPLDHPENNSYATLNSIQENYEAIPSTNHNQSVTNREPINEPIYKVVDYEMPDNKPINEPIYKVVDYEMPDNVYQGIENLNFHPDNKHVRTEMSVNSQNIDNIYHELES